MTPLEYIANNAIQRVRFRDALEAIPSNAVVIEIGASGLFQNILKKKLGSSATVLSLMERLSSSSLEFFYSSIGK